MKNLKIPSQSFFTGTLRGHSFSTASDQRAINTHTRPHLTPYQIWSDYLMSFNEAPANEFEPANVVEAVPIEPFTPKIVQEVPPIIGHHQELLARFEAPRTFERLAGCSYLNVKRALQTKALICDEMRLRTLMSQRMESGLFQEIHNELHQSFSIEDVGEVTPFIEEQLKNQIGYSKILNLRFSGGAKPALVLHSGGGLRPPKQPPYDGFGGGGDNFGNDPVALIVFSLVLLVLSYLIYNYGIKNLEKGLAELQKKLEEWATKDPRNKKKRIYSMFLKALTIVTALFATPEAFLRAVEILGSPMLRGLMRLLRFGARIALAISLFLGSGVHFLNWYKYLMKFLGPLINKTIHFLSGPANISLTALFVEKLLKSMFLSVLFGYWCFCFKKSCCSQKKARYIFLMGIICLAFYLVVRDFVWIRQFAFKTAENSLIQPLISCQTGRLLLLAGSILLIRSFTFLPGISIAFILLVNLLGVLSLAQVASSNAFPVIKKSI